MTPLIRLAVHLALGRRLPVVDGDLTVPGMDRPILIRRDEWGIPHIEAETDTDAAFAIGFCHAQDRGFQLEASVRVSRGTLAELVGPPGLPVDRASRRIGFHRAAVAQVAAVDTDVRAGLEAYCRGVNAGFAHGLPAKPHEFSFLGGEPTVWEPPDVLAFLKLQSFLLPSNWDCEIARLRILLADGPAAVRDLDPAYPADHPITVPSGPTIPALDALLADLTAIQSVLPGGGGSNNWAISGRRTASGKPILASDPHLGPTLPGPWHLAHVTTPNWSVAGATLAGTPAFPIGHNGFAAWGVTAGLTDNCDLFLEPVDAPTTVVRETIRVKGAADHIEEVHVTPRGPILTPVLGGFEQRISLRAVWLDPLPLRGFLDAPRARSWEEFRAPFAAWPVLPLNVLYADETGTLGYQLIGQLPVRNGHHGTIPVPAVDWAGYVPFTEMPHAVDPAEGFFATANNRPASDGPFLGVDYVDGYRTATIREELAARDTGWTLADCTALQRNVRSKPWAELRDTVLSLAPTSPNATLALDLLRDWDGHVTAKSAAAAVMELFVADLSCRIAQAKAPKEWATAVGGLGKGMFAHSLFTDRRVGHLVNLVRTQPAGWFPHWPTAMLESLASAVQTLRDTRGPSPEWWTWGDARPLHLRHPLLGKHWLLKRLFNADPLPCGGDQNTVSQAGVRPLAPLAPTHNMANLRTVFAVGDWDTSRVVLAGGQSGNPLSPNFLDQLPLWHRGDTVPFPWTPDAVLRASKHCLRLLPGEPGA